jgi:fructose-specific phosphotransferase system IIC component
MLATVWFMSVFVAFMSVFLVEFSAVQAACALRWASVDSAGEGGLSFLQAIIRAALVVSLAYFPPFTPCLFVGIHTPLTEGSLCERIAQSSCFQFNRFGLFSFSFFSKEDWSDRTAKLMLISLGATAMPKKTRTPARSNRY